MKDLIICHYKEGKGIQDIFLLKDGQPQRHPFDAEILAHAIGEFAMAQQIYEIDLYGNEESTKPIKEEIISLVDERSKGTELLINLKPEKIKPELEREGLEIEQ